MRTAFLAAFAAFSLSLSAVAQKIQVFGGAAERASSSLVLFGENLMAGVTVTYGQPAWQPEYDTMLDKLKGRLNRLGKDMWTTLLTTVPLELGGAKVEAGSYVVGLMCDKDGKFHLALLDATKAAKAGTLPFGQQTWTPDVLCPLTLNKDGAKEAAEKMTMTLAADAKDPSNGTFTLAWGKHTLTGALKLQLAK
jgi:hypothetical protein